MRNCIFSLIFFITLFQNLSAQNKPKDSWWEKMDIGPTWMNTFDDYFGGKKRSGTLKGISIDLGEGWRGLFDTETLRLVRVSQETIEWGATPWTGAHGVIIAMGNQNPLQITATGSAWADPEGSFDDKRKLAGFGNMPHAMFTGHYLYGREVVLE